MKTLIVIILDESGSMDTKKDEVIEEFNKFISDQKEIKNDIAKLYLVKFNNVVTTVYTGLPLNELPALTSLNYKPKGRTALYDAISEAIQIVDKDKNDHERVVCVIMTDGEENGSQETTIEQVKFLITDHEARGDWTFLYIGKNPERWTKETGMSANHAINFNNESIRESYSMTQNAVKKFRMQPEAQSSGLFD